MLQAMKNAYTRCEINEEAKRLSRVSLIESAKEKIENVLKTIEHFEQEVYVNLPELTKEERINIEEEMTKMHNQVCVCSNVEKNPYGNNEESQATWISIEFFPKKDA